MSTSSASIPMSGTGLDQIVEAILADPGLTTARNPANQAAKLAQTLEGAKAAAGMIGLISDALDATGVAADGAISIDDVVMLNTWLRADQARLTAFTAFHGDDENGVETGFHQVQCDGAVTQFRGENFVNKIADGLFHLAFEIKDGHFLNEDGNANASLGSVASWLNYFVLGKSEVLGTAGNDVLRSGASDERFQNADNEIFYAGAGNDVVKAGVGDDLIYGGAGNDRLFGDVGRDILFGEAGNDKLFAGSGADRLVGGAGADLLDLGYDYNSDTVVFARGDSGIRPGTIDTVMNFTHGIDKIDLTDFAGLHFAGAAFTGHGPEAIFRAGMLMVDANGDSVADMMVQFQGAGTVVNSFDLLMA